MASFLRKLMWWLNSPEGRRLKEQAKRAARDPHKRRQAEQLLRRLRKR